MYPDPLFFVLLLTAKFCFDTRNDFFECQFLLVRPCHTTIILDSRAFPVPFDKRRSHSLLVDLDKLIRVCDIAPLRRVFGDLILDGAHKCVEVHVLFGIDFPVVYVLTIDLSVFPHNDLALVFVGILLREMPQIKTVFAWIQMGKVGFMVIRDPQILIDPFHATFVKASAPLTLKSFPKIQDPLSDVAIPCIDLRRVPIESGNTQSITIQYINSKNLNKINGQRIDLVSFSKNF